MKNSKSHRIFVTIAVLLMLGFTLQAQTSQEAQKQKQEQLEQEKQMRELEMKLRKQHLEQEQKMKELERTYEVQAREAARVARSSARERAFVYASPSTGVADEGSYFIQFGQENQSQLTIRNSFDGETDSAEGEFDVDESTTHIRCTINGKANAGKIAIKIMYPGGKVFKDLSITSSAQISFSQSLTIKEEEKKKYVGSWTYKVSADKAEGSYSLSFMTH